MSANWLTQTAFNNSRIIYLITVLVVLIPGVFIPTITIDTDPENMLPEDNPVFEDNSNVYVRSRYSY